MNPTEGTAPERRKDARRSTRLTRQIPLVITSLDPNQRFVGKFDTVVVNAHGCGVILPVRLRNGTPVTLELVSTGVSKTAKIVLTISIVEGASWLVGFEFDTSTENFWGIENPPQDWFLP